VFFFFCQKIVAMTDVIILLNTSPAIPQFYGGYDTPKKENRLSYDALPRTGSKHSKTNESPQNHKVPIAIRCTVRAVDGRWAALRPWRFDTGTTISSVHFTSNALLGRFSAGIDVGSWSTAHI